VSIELERRLEGMLAAAPEPDPGAGEEALHRALRALQPAAPARRGLRATVLVFAAAVVLLVISAGSLAAVGALHVSFGAKAKEQPGSTQLSLPRGVHGIATLVDGRLSVVTKEGFRLQGLRASAAALSPHALYIAAGIGDSLVAMAPGGRRAWSYDTGGPVVAIAWAPDGLLIAYVVRDGKRLVLHTIWGNGTHDSAIDRSVRDVTPSWRADSIAFAYVGAGGKAIVYDLSHRSRTMDAASPSDVTQVAYAPTGAKFALFGGNHVVVGRRQLSPSFPLAGIGWLGTRFVLVGRNGQFGPIHVFARIVSFESTGGPFAAVAVAGNRMQVLAGTARRIATVLSVPRTSRVQAVGVR
jgi:hypothetical protein